jgi:hypothetical protein
VVGDAFDEAGPAPPGLMILPAGSCRQSLAQRRQCLRGVSCSLLTRQRQLRAMNQVSISRRQKLGLNLPTSATGIPRRSP